MGFKTKLSLYYRLSKPGIIYANVIAAVAGYLFASKLSIDLIVASGLVVGLALVIAGACSYNNYLDRTIDKAMARTQKRGLVTGDISGPAALIYATLVTLLGFALLLTTQNGLTVLLVFIALIAYVILYGIAKRTTVHGTLIGCISGSLPLVAGYTAFTSRLDTVAFLLFVLMTAWQMAHFYGIALYRQKDYAKAHIPVMPVVYGADTTKYQAVTYIVLFIIVSGCLIAGGHIGVIGGIALIALGVAWLYKSLIGYSRLTPEVWGKRVFLFSLTVMLGMSFILSFQSVVA